MNCAIDATTAEHPFVCGVNDSVDFHTGNVAVNYGWRLHVVAVLR